MTDEVENGGSAFPVLTTSLMREHQREAGRFTHDYRSEGGMSLRDWFAGQALAGMLANPDRLGTEAKFIGWANQSYFFADAMIAARKTGAA